MRYPVRWRLFFAASPLCAIVCFAKLEDVVYACIEAVVGAALERAIERGVMTAGGRDGIPGIADNRM